MLLGLLASLVVFAHSRSREFEADRKSTLFSGKDNMLRSLLKLKRIQTEQEQAPLPAELKAFGISGDMSGLFSTHPNIDDRIKALRG
jgi:heat shock protein HtpX